MKDRIFCKHCGAYQTYNPGILCIGKCGKKQSHKAPPTHFPPEDHKISQSQKMNSLLTGHMIHAALYDGYRVFLCTDDKFIKLYPFDDVSGSAHIRSVLNISSLFGKRICDAYCTLIPFSTKENRLFINDRYRYNSEFYYDIEARGNYRSSYCRMIISVDHCNLHNLIGVGNTIFFTDIVDKIELADNDKRYGSLSILKDF